jgi:hypothetical protein
MTNATLQILADRATIADTVLLFARSFDIQNWSLMRACLLDSIEVDYMVFRGEPVKIIRADVYIESRRSALSRLKTQHLVTGHIISVEGDESECISNFVIYRFAPEVEADNRFDTHGTYTFRLYRSGETWLIGKIKQTVLWSSGNPGIHGAHRDKPKR